MGSEIKILKKLTRAASQSYLGFGLLVGFFLILLTYCMVSEQFAIRAPNGTFSRLSPSYGANMSPLVQDKTRLEEDRKSEPFEEEDDIEEQRKTSVSSTDHDTENERKPQDQQGEDQTEKYEQDPDFFKGDNAPTTDAIESNHFETERKPEDRQQKDRIDKFGEELNPFKNDDAPRKDPIDSNQFGNERKAEEWHENKGNEKTPQQINPFMTEDAQKKDAIDFMPFGGGNQNTNQFGPQTKPICDMSDAKFDFCEMNGDVRVIGSASTVLHVPNQMSYPNPHEWKIRPYSRKYMQDIKEVTVKSLNGPHEAPPCSVKERIPAVVFALGGLTGNYWHDFTDIIIPLFVTSRQFSGEVQFLITNIQPWWIGKYTTIFKKLSRYEFIDMDKDNLIRCYPHVIVGILSHKEFSIDPARAPNGYSIVDFTKFMRLTYSLERDNPIKLSQNLSGKKPRLLIIARGLSRRFTNVPEIVGSAERLGFEVVVADAKFDVQLGEFARIVNSCDVLMGVHGAGLTNCVFLPTNAVMIQVVPYGKLEHMAKMDFGDPAIDMKLKYLEYSISAEESTLMDMFGKDHPIIKDPIAIHNSGWEKVGEFYLGKQDIRLDTRRFEPTLLKALELLQ
ncbi:uncharacterized protein LOC109710022 isoform X2 [Ananas comosus]|uniref:Uncharacterized protein LOC109710022 isoform X2 n=1 Tax=Ananas comosus TaxID=4615 RepID=A0A6P5F402_ANACO|nr:uncharacterized protein LOC109710022 isoform X2 [Ananas comosus]